MKMKYSKNGSFFLILFVLVFTNALFVSCREEGAGGPPSITRVRAMNAELADSSFVTALPGQLIVIEGVNLSEVQEIYFNNYPAVFNPAYNTATHVVVQIPINTPTPDRYPNVSGILRVVTKHGSVDYKFAVHPPAPLLNHIYNENACSGDTMEIYGQFLLGVNEVVFPGGIISTDIQSNEAGTQLRVTVPEGVTEAGYLTLRSPYGTVTTRFLVNNTKGPGVFANFNKPGELEYGWNGWGAVRSNDSSLFPKNDGYYMHSFFSNVGTNNPAWWENNRNVSVDNYDKVVVPVSELGNHPGNYQLKFEINTRIPIEEGVVFLIGFKWDKLNYEFHPYALETNRIFDTKNAWRTIAIPLSEYKVETIGTLLESNGAIGRMHLGIISKGKAISKFDAAFDNFRIEKTNK